MTGPHKDHAANVPYITMDGDAVTTVGVCVKLEVLNA